MSTIFKAICTLAAIYFLFQIGRAYGRSEKMIGTPVPISCDSRANTYNEIMLRNCLQKNGTTK